jgi:hypothetical protein
MSVEYLAPNELFLDSPASILGAHYEIQGHGKRSIRGFVGGLR